MLTNKFKLLVFFFAMVLIAGTYAGLMTWIEQDNRTYPLDIDGWAHMIGQVKNSGFSLGSLFEGPYIKKGPITPFVFGLTYYVFPDDQSILIFNVLAFALAAGFFFLGFCMLGASRTSVISAIALWMLYLYTHKYVFGHYFAEPFLSLLNAILILLVALAILKANSYVVIMSGVVAGILLLARAPYIIVIIGIPLLFWLHFDKNRYKNIVLFSISLMLIYMPWPVRNFISYGKFIPFATDGGIVFFQGTYLKGDSDVINNVRKLPEFREIENRVKERPDIEQYQYWQTLAIQQIRQDPLGQIYLVIRKALRFWLYLPAYSWMPSWKTAVMATLCLPFAFLGFISSQNRLLVHLCALWVGGLWLFHAIVYAELRYNFPIIPMMFMLMITGIFSFTQQFASVSLQKTKSR